MDRMKPMHDPQFIPHGAIMDRTNVIEVLYFSGVVFLMALNSLTLSNLSFVFKQPAIIGPGSSFLVQFCDYPGFFLTAKTAEKAQRTQRMLSKPGAKTVYKPCYPVVKKPNLLLSPKQMFF